MNQKKSPIIVALDFSDEKQVLSFVEQIYPKLCRLKVGKELFTTCGPEIIHKLQNKGFEIFLDLKFHDIPNTTAKAVQAAAKLGIWMVNVHCSGGLRMMQACYDILQKQQHKPLLIGVTVLTSMLKEDLIELNISKELQTLVNELATLANKAGLDGLVCSAHEAKFLKQQFANFKLVTPGIRLNSNVLDDQRRTMTPPQAILEGSDYLVIGRPITKSTNPLQTLEQIYKSINN